MAVLFGGRPWLMRPPCDDGVCRTEVLVTADLADYLPRSGVR
jgi:hypothetical protein